jgi:2-C-methyl-D-erythritol 2,4-cyclodiphosphate synthase
MRVGLGHDIHRLAAGRKLVLGGVLIDFDKGPVSHSDGDVLLHAVVDAVLGAAGLGDIGIWFPDSDPQWAGADSAELLGVAVEAAGKQNWKIVNLDCTLFAEKPRLGPYRERMEDRLATLLGISADAINVKAKSGEQVGPIGREEAISAAAVVLLARDE